MFGETNVLKIYPTIDPKKRKGQGQKVESMSNWNRTFIFEKIKKIFEDHVVFEKKSEGQGQRLNRCCIGIEPLFLKKLKNIHL